jgi:hypothetical protein
MLRKLFRSNIQSVLSSQKQARLSELSEYLCLRENLNSQAAEKASSEFKSLASKYGLEGKNLIQLFTLINQNTKNLHKYYTPEDATAAKEALLRKWRNSDFYDPSVSFDGIFNQHDV